MIKTWLNIIYKFVNPLRWYAELTVCSQTTSKNTANFSDNPLGSNPVPVSSMHF